ncbi:MAG TPA: chromosome segregation protein SMC [Candidatus Acetatifactor stercoripullorum]|uniref:Chromosome partition protein Smc n=1 Tax=Candidatus Acetatifactor stercoripullorum TaxID=2838414 RepID=A0A9D1UAG0_9FIRM|nr:chromosome segregation protein SMC [Candidatus Acetatifactor stercoripullorum]HIW80592.1 chromosome segregation protein SMC [Candidatus Acetatifactor stercoripullorum]
MYLKSIEIHGFKSFANKITFQFHNGITGIVGPNGSGKSNVADAVRWVLGEQRIKQLRGASMQDVIFSGTETRKPLSYAYVAITLDNGDHQLAIDYDEVTVARRIYRSGESEYLINGTPCRLKDVNELFYDTGIGKEGYSIIGQGQIDKILSGKPEERRELFDEAAGIVKFKRRKAAAQSKLANEKQNLVRVNDILSELEKQVGPLEKQSEKAKIYLRKKEELKTLDVNVFLLENSRLKEQLKAVEEKYGIAGGDLKEITQRYEGIKEEYDQIQGEIERLDKSIEEARSTLTDTGLLRGRLEGQINVLKEQINSAKGSESHLNGRKEALEAEIASKSQDKEGILAEKQKTDEQVEEIAGAALQARARLLEIQDKIEELNNCIEAGKNTIIGELNQRAAIKSKMGRYDTMMEQINIRRAELNSRLLRVKSDEAAREEALLKLEESFESITKELGEMNRKQGDMEKELGDIRGVLTGKDQKLRETQSAYHQESSRLEALSNLTERYEGYGGSVKKVMEQKEKEKGIIGVVADIIKVEKKYETAIETALGGNIQNIVTDDENTAKRMIGYLKANRLGRATFLPLTSIIHPQEFKSPEILEEKGVIGMADELVEIEDRYRNVAKAMLGRIVVIDNVDNAVRIAKKSGYSVRMVTLEGELLVPGGAISGGAFKNNSNLLGRRREIEELQKKTRKLLSAVEEINGEIKSTKERRNELRLALENIKSEIGKKSIEQNTVRLSISQARERMEEEMEGAKSLELEEKEIEGKIREIKDGKEAIAQELSASEELEAHTKEQILSFQKELEERREEETLESGRVAQWDLKVEKMRQTQTFKQSNVDRINGELEKSQAELSQILQALSENEEEVERKKQNIKELEKTIAASHEAQNASEIRLKEEAARKEELSAKQKNFFQSREKLAEQMSSLDKEVYRLNAQKERLEDSIEAQINYMWDEYEITLSDAASLRDEDMLDLPAMKRGITDLKDQIKKLGDVNVNAIEDYKNLMERYTFMKTQHDDLVEAEKTLEGIIEELDGAMRKQFTEKFAQISREFDKVFKELFGGGKGTLELMEDEDILEAGIRIIAQPPGKKLQNMMQLSGGEKALSAISLLFAIQNLKPSPFCLLDEIEAALDDSNVGRFAKYLHKLTKNTQFIVITHRRGTMEQVDRLYGITMQEKGVSTLVSVNLIDKELED